MTFDHPIHSIVLVKQVPDTRSVSGEVMTAEGTLNRSALPAIFNPEDLHALEMALQIKDQHGGRVTVLTMGPLQAAAVLREALYRGADQVFLISDRKFSGADTQATSYTLSRAIAKVGPFDLLFCGRQAIDGDTAQVGPQVAEKLGVPQVTYAESILSLGEGDIVVQRAFELGAELVKCRLPCLLTVVSSANRPRPASARKRIEYKLAAVPAEYPALLKKHPQLGDEAALDRFLAERNLKIPLWTAADLDIDESQIGLGGSPTQVYKVNFVVLEGGESKEIPANYEGIKALIQELIQEYIVG
jgi:electron transfer flavoprotein beta subunit